jgi:hypothetical protein
MFSLPPPLSMPISYQRMVGFLSLAAADPATPKPTLEWVSRSRTRCAGGGKSLEARFDTAPDRETVIAPNNALHQRNSMYVIH